MCQAYRRQYGALFFEAMPTNLFGPGDNFGPLNAHVIPGLMRRIHEAKTREAQEVTIWGTGTPWREFLYVEDLADACFFLMEHYNEGEIINVGVGQDMSIAELAHLVARVVVYKGRLVFDPSYPDGTPRKLLDISCLTHMGWRAQTSLETGLRETYAWFSRHLNQKGS